MSAPPKVGIDARGRLVATGVFAWREAIRDLPGSMWAPAGKYWALPATPGSAAALLTVLSGSGAVVSPKVLALAQEFATREARRSAAADESTPLPELDWSTWLKTSPWPHQRRGALFLRDSSAALLAATMGAGKSLTIVAAANMREVSRALVIAPASVAGVWARELRLHSAREWHVVTGRRKTRTGSLVRMALGARWEEAVAAWTRCGCGKPHAVVSSYEAMTREPLASADLRALGVDALIFDEAHRLKSAGGAASWTAKSWVNQVPWRVAATGTPMPQNPDDVYGLFRALDPSIFGTSKTEFRARFIVMGQTRDGRAFPKDVFKNRRTEFSRRFHSITYLPQVDLRLPPVTHTVRSFDLEPAARRVYDEIRDHGLAEISAAVVAAGGNPTPAGDERTVAPANAGVELLRLAQVTGGTTMDDDGNPVVVSTAKAAALGEVSRGKLTGGVLHEVGCVPGGRDGRSRPEPVVVYCRFRADLAAVAEVATAGGLRYGEISGSRKDGLTEDAKMADVDVLGVQIASGGVGIDLTRSRVAIWWSVGFEAWLFAQAQARQHRPGQTRQVSNIYLIASDTIDGAIYAALARKQSVIDTVTDAYLRGEAEMGDEALPAMAVPEGEIAGEQVDLPAWMSQPSPRPVPDVAREQVHRQLSLSGMEGLLDG